MDFPSFIHVVVFPGSSSGCWVWSSNSTASNNEESVKRRFFITFWKREKLRGGGNLKRKLRRFKVENRWMNGIWSILTWRAHVYENGELCEHTNTGTHVHKWNLRLFHQNKQSAEPQNPGELRASRVGRILICCDLNDSEPEG